MIRLKMYLGERKMIKLFNIEKPMWKLVLEGDSKTLDKKNC